MSQSTSRSRSVKAYDNYKLWSPPPDPATISRCPVCNSPGEVWQYSDSPDSQLLRVVMCTRGEAFGPQEGIVNEGCLLYMPPEAFYRATTKEAVRYWNDYAKALLVVRSESGPTDIKTPEGHKARPHRVAQGVG